MRLAKVDGVWFYGSPDCLRVPDVEYAEEDEAGQLSLGVAGEQRALPGLAQEREEKEDDPVRS